MEELFRSLSESVSEECYNDILNIVESIINETKKESKEKRDTWMADQMSKEPVYSKHSGDYIKKTAKQLLAGKKSDFENTSKAWKNYYNNEKNKKQLEDKWTEARKAFRSGDGSWEDKYNAEKELKDARNNSIPLLKKASNARSNKSSNRKVWQEARINNKYGGDPLEDRATIKGLIKKGVLSSKSDHFSPVTLSNVGAKIPKPKN